MRMFIIVPCLLTICSGFFLYFLFRDGMELTCGVGSKTEVRRAFVGARTWDVEQIWSFFLTISPWSTSQTCIRMTKQQEKNLQPYYATWVDGWQLYHIWMHNWTCSHQLAFYILTKHKKHRITKPQNTKCHQGLIETWGVQGAYKIRDCFWAPRGAMRELIAGAMCLPCRWSPLSCSIYHSNMFVEYPQPEIKPRILDHQTALNILKQY